MAGATQPTQGSYEVHMKSLAFILKCEYNCSSTQSDASWLPPLGGPSLVSGACSSIGQSTPKSKERLWVRVPPGVLGL